jgi:hypothetical protein
MSNYGSSATDLRTLLIASLAAAGVGFAGPWVLGFNFAERYSVWFAALWLALVVAAVIRHRAHGLGLLIGAPLALYWPGAFMLISVACRHDVRACP